MKIYQTSPNNEIFVGRLYCNTTKVDIYPAEHWEIVCPNPNHLTNTNFLTLLELVRNIKEQSVFLFLGWRKSKAEQGMVLFFLHDRQKICIPFVNSASVRAAFKELEI